MKEEVDLSIGDLLIYEDGLTLPDRTTHKFIITVKYIINIINYDVYFKSFSTAKRPLTRMMDDYYWCILKDINEGKCTLQKVKKI